MAKKRLPRFLNSSGDENITGNWTFTSIFTEYIRAAVNRIVLRFIYIANAVNYITIRNAVNNNDPVLSVADSTTTNTGLNLEMKGTGELGLFGSQYNKPTEHLLSLEANKVKTKYRVVDAAVLPDVPDINGIQLDDNSKWSVDLYTFETCAREGYKGAIVADTNYVYTCIADNTWVRDSRSYVLKEVGKGLSENNYTTTEKNKLAGIESNAQANVQADWGAESGPSAIANKPESFPPAEHSHSWESVTGKPDEFTPASHSHSWGSVTGKPSVFPPEAHSHDDRYAGKIKLSGEITFSSDDQLVELDRIQLPDNYISGIAVLSAVKVSGPSAQAIGSIKSGPFFFVINQATSWTNAPTSPGQFQGFSESGSGTPQLEFSIDGSDIVVSVRNNTSNNTGDTLNINVVISLLNTL